MSRVITFSRTYPSYHPRAGEPTYFIEKVVKSLHKQGVSPWDIDLALWWDEMYHLCDPKHHTIRAGYRWKAGDWFSPRVWSGKPYGSKQITFAPDIQVKKTWDVEIDEADIWAIGLPGTQIKYLDEDQCARISLNDGLTEQDMYFWFKEAKKPFVGQVICWSDEIEY